jgi:hypothetical protein
MKQPPRSLYSLGRALRAGSLVGGLVGAGMLTVLLPGCAPMSQHAAPPVGITDLAARPAESALLQGLRAYDDGQYADAEAQLKSALAKGLAAPHDQAAAHKTLAFIYCTSNREDQCAQEFLAARQADAHFVLNKAESGHPIWGPVYRRVLGAPAP